MRPIVYSIIAASFLTLLGCSSASKNIAVSKQLTTPISSAAQVAQAGNSSEMDSYLNEALVKSGLKVKAPMAEGTRKSEEVDVLVSYSDAWSWDLVTYLRSLSVRIVEANSGELIAAGNWVNSRPHGFYSPREVVQMMISDTLESVGVKRGNAQ